MDKKQPRYIVTFRPGTPEMVVVSLFAIGGAAVAVWVSLIVRAVDCGADSDSECSTRGLLQVLVALAGVLPAAATLVASARRRGRPWRWLVLTRLTYGLWILFLVW